MTPLTLSFLGNPVIQIICSFLKATPAVPILFFLMIFDILTGMAAAYIAKELNSSVSWKGMIRKTVVILLLGVSLVIDPLTPQVPEANFVGLFFVANELLSILENAVRCGVPIPPALVNTMIKVREFSTSDKRLPPPAPTPTTTTTTTTTTKTEETS